ncbi:MAG: IgGFc-binding protein, partial [Deltaproteobacteria bacterium]|nr:IgGFc-binding protein [Deltaproteobacteria bacterium]
ANHPIGGTLECPVPPAVLLDAAVHGSGVGKAFEILSDTPITAYDIMPYGGARSYLPSASLVYPRTAWGTNYVAVSPHPESSGQLWVLLVGSVDGTQVDVAPPTTLPGGTGVAQAPGGQVTNLTVNAGEIVQWLGADPTGAVFQANHPIGMFTGNTYLRVSTSTSPSGGGQDSAHQMIPPVNALGSEYVAGNVVTRRASLQPESGLYRIMGAVDGTQLTWDPTTPPGAPTTLAAGQVAEYETADLHRVTSQDADHPFAMSQYMGGAIGLDRPGCGPVPPMSGMQCELGDEEWVVMLPPEQFLSRYVFFTDPTYATTNVVITRVRGPQGFADVDIACLGAVTGWQPVGTSGDYEVAHVDLVRGGIGAQPACATSRHEASSEGAFGVMVWGSDYYASYGYPAGGNIGTINDVVIVPVPK